MPDFYAHQVFGGLVLSALPDPARTRIEAEKEGWLCGLYGPDPLFFHSLRRGDPVCAEGHRLHSCPPAQVLERFRAAAGRVPCATGYAAGFLCHYVLDAVCHPIVNRHTQGSSLGHTRLEGAFDRALISPGETGLPARFSPDSPVYSAAALGYSQAGPEQFRRALNHFCRLSRLIAKARRLTPAGGRWRQGAAELRAGMEGAVLRCAELVSELIGHLEAGQALDFLPNTDFNGQEMPETAPVHPL